MVFCEFDVWLAEGQVSTLSPCLPRMRDIMVWALNNVYPFSVTEGPVEMSSLAG